MLGFPTGTPFGRASLTPTYDLRESLRDGVDVGFGILFGGEGPIGGDATLANKLVETGMGPISGAAHMAVFDGVVVDIRHMPFHEERQNPCRPGYGVPSLHLNCRFSAKSPARPYSPDWHYALPAKANRAKTPP